MDVREIPIMLPALTEINADIQDLIRKNVKTIVSEILKKVADNEHLEHDTLLKHFTEDMIEYDFKKKLKKHISVDDRCIAKIGTGAQCTRHRKDKEQYCGSHLASRRFGVVESSEFPDSPDDSASSESTLQ